MALDCPYLYHTALLTCSFCTCEFPEVLLGKARDEGAEFLFSCYCMEMEEKGKEVTETLCQGLRALMFGKREAMEGSDNGRFGEYVSSFRRLEKVSGTAMPRDQSRGSGFCFPSV